MSLSGELSHRRDAGWGPLLRQLIFLKNLQHKSILAMVFFCVVRVSILPHLGSACMHTWAQVHCLGCDHTTAHTRGQFARQHMALCLNPRSNPTVRLTPLSITAPYLPLLRAQLPSAFTALDILCYHYLGRWLLPWPFGRMKGRKRLLLLKPSADSTSVGMCLQDKHNNVSS